MDWTQNKEPMLAKIYGRFSDFRCNSAIPGCIPGAAVAGIEQLAIGLKTPAEGKYC